MIYITSDIHIPEDVKKINTRFFSRRLHVSESDTLLICGDFGGVWDGDSAEKHWLDWLAEKPFTTLFIDGNHENHKRLATEFPEIDFRGGRAHRIQENVLHLMRGYVFELEGNRIFAMGGAASHDKAYRREGVNWWPEELPSEEEYIRATDSLSRCGWKVDYVITHCAPENIQQEHFPGYPPNALTGFLQEISQKLAYRHWYFGHYHVDRQIDDRHTCLFNAVIPLDD